MPSSIRNLDRVIPLSTFLVLLAATAAILVANSEDGAAHGLLGPQPASRQGGASAFRAMTRAIGLKPAASAVQLRQAAEANARTETTKNQPAAEFEYQEMKVQLDALKRQRLAPRDLDALKRMELASYVKEVSTKRPSHPALSEIADELPGTTWRLAFSTQEAALGDLPRDATVTIEFLDGENLDYVLSFGEKTFGLKNIKARSRWNFASDGDDRGLVTFVYDKITTDAFGMQNLGVGLFGLLKGRANYVESAYFDGKYWSERGLNPDGTRVFWNVYVKED